MPVNIANRRLDVAVIGPGGCGKTTFINRETTGSLTVRKDYQLTSTSVGMFDVFYHEFLSQEFESAMECDFAIIFFDENGSMNDFWEAYAVKSALRLMPHVFCSTKCDKVNGVEKIDIIALRNQCLDTGCKFYRISAKSIFNHEKPIAECMRQLFHAHLVCAQ